MFFLEVFFVCCNVFVVVLWKYIMVFVGLFLFGVVVGIGNIVVGVDLDDGCWYFLGGLFVFVILVSYIFKCFVIYMVNCLLVFDIFFVL